MTSPRRDGAERGWLLLASLNEAIEGLAAHADLASFWAVVCRSARWVVPGKRLSVVLREDDAEPREIARLFQGQLTDPPALAVRVNEDPIGRIFSSAEGARPVWLEGDAAAPGERDELREWLLADQPALVLCAPLRHLRKVIGHMLWTFAPLPEDDRKAALVSATSFALQVGVVYTQLQTTTSLRSAREDLERKNTDLEEAQRELSQQLALIQAQNEQLLAMSAPIMKVGPGVVMLPVVGVVDAARARRIAEALLHAVATNRARCAIVDLTGMAPIEMDVLDPLMKLIEAVGLLGSECVLSGISPALAQRLVAHDVSLMRLRIFANLESALEHVIAAPPKSAPRSSAAKTPTTG